jgi:hypothetical protein
MASVRGQNVHFVTSTVVHLDVSACRFSTSSRRLTNSSLHVSLRCLTSSRRRCMSHFDVSLRRGVYLIRRCMSHFVATSELIRRCSMSHFRGVYFRSIRRFVYPFSGACISSLHHFVAAFRLFVSSRRFVSSSRRDLFPPKMDTWPKVALSFNFLLVRPHKKKLVSVLSFCQKEGGRAVCFLIYTYF